MLAQFMTAQKRFLATFQTSSSNILSSVSQTDEANGDVIGTQQSEDDEEPDNIGTDYEDDEEALTKARNMTQLLEGFLSCLSPVDRSNKIVSVDVNVNANVNANVNLDVNSIEKNDIIEENIADKTTKRVIEPKTEEVELDATDEGHQECTNIMEPTPMIDKEERSKSSVKRKRIKKEMKKKRKSVEKKDGRKDSKRMRKEKKEDKGDYFSENADP